MATKFSATTGNDTTGTGTQLNPWLTAQKLASNLAAGDTGYLRAGVYTTDVQISPSGSGGTSWANPIVFGAYPGEVATIRPNAGPQFALALWGAAVKFWEFNGYNPGSPLSTNLVIDGVNLTGSCIKTTDAGSPGVNSATSIRMLNVEIKRAGGLNPGNTDGSGWLVGNGCNDCELVSSYIHHNGISNFHHGIYIGGKRFICRDNVFTQNAGEEIQLYSQSHANVTDGSRIYRNNIHHASANSNPGGFYRMAVSLSDGDDIWFYNNIVNVGNGGGVELFTDAGVTNALIAHNSIYGVTGPGIIIPAGALNAKVYNNALWSCGSYISNSGTGSDLRNNIANGVDDPDFANAGAGDFTLLAGSPAIGAGYVLPPPYNAITTDYAGVTRNSPPDIGAYQFVPVGSGQPPRTIHQQRRRRVFA